MRRMVKQLAKTFIREWRKHRHLTIVALGASMDMTPGNLSRLERGEVPYSQESLERAAAALGVSPADLLSRPPSDGDGDEDEHELFALVHNVPKEDRETVKRVLRGIIAAKKTGS